MKVPVLNFSKERPASWGNIETWLSKNYTGCSSVLEGLNGEGGMDGRILISKIPNKNESIFS